MLIKNIIIKLKINIFNKRKIFFIIVLTFLYRRTNINKIIYHLT